MQVRAQVPPGDHLKLLQVSQHQDLNLDRGQKPQGQQGSQLQMQVHQPDGVMKEAKQNLLQRAANLKNRTAVLHPAGNNTKFKTR
jgi:hypothetical protein